MVDYWIAYQIVDSHGVFIGFGTTRTPMAGPPQTAIEVDRLADSISSGGLPSGQHAVVLSWSEMGR